ncbi:MAG: GNAT family N-acetyltransferase [Alphaproteobacteria bacterium]|nr:GNAT family N-acetyltransferase [Alphaproteobacteria bacterium]
MDTASLPTITITVTHLAMEAPPTTPARRAPPLKLAILRAEEPTVAFYRFLYGTVGEPWQWTKRRLMEDDEIAANIRHPKVTIYVLYIGGVPAGYAELDFRPAPDADLAYFGLMPEFVGRRLGGYFLDWAVRALWAGGAGRLTVNTCDLDHPRALQAYQRAGFVPTRRETEELVPIDVVRSLGR